MVSRMGLASGYGVPAKSIEKAFHEYGINYFYISPILNQGRMVGAIRNLAPDYRDELFIVLPRAIFKGFRLENFVNGWLRKLRIEWVDLLFQGLEKPPNEKLTDRLQRLKTSGKVRFVGISGHDRQYLGKVASGEVKVPIDFFHTRYNAAHTGAEHDIFPHLQPENRPGIVVFTATCWGKLLKAKLTPEGERPLTAAECYRFVLSHPDVNVCISAPSKAEQMEANFTALDDGPLTREETARVRRIGQHVYGRSKVPVLAR